MSQSFPAHRNHKTMGTVVGAMTSGGSAGPQHFCTDHLGEWRHRGGIHSPVFTNDNSVLEMNADISTSCLVLFVLRQTAPHPHFPLRNQESVI